MLLSLIILFSSELCQNFGGGFSFYLPADDTVSSEFLPHFPMHKFGSREFVIIDSHDHFTVENQRIRLWGTNSVADGAFPDKSKAWFVAGRQNKMGFNLIRFHHLDINWCTSLFEPGRDTRHLNRVTLDRLEKYISELKKKRYLYQYEPACQPHF
jgi:hypothetical protein